jgi:dolichyl-phosphate-mannose--protein O-mannosyl transferase
MKLKAAWLLALICIVSTLATIAAMRRTSPTFDEVVLYTAGARGYHNGGTFDLAPDHPPLMQYVYGLPVFLSKPTYPSEKGWDTQSTGYRYLYARQMLYDSGNDPKQMSFLGRLPAVLFVLLLILATYFFTRRHFGATAALIAATLVAFLPDVLAHGGVAYNDLPLAFAYLAAIWALDNVIRMPTWQRGVLAGVAVGFAFGVKISAVALGPAAIVLVLLELVHRGVDLEWIRKIVPATLVSLAAAYVTLALIYGGDFSLQQFQYGLTSKFQHVTTGHGASGFILGKGSPQGFWYFFPLAFLFKTSAALHVLGVIALAALLKVEFPRKRDLLVHPMRAPLIGAAVFAAALLTSSLNIGFRYALPVLPLLCIMIAAGVAYMWEQGERRLRAVVLALLAWVIIAPLTWYPNFLAYISEYGPGRDRGSEVLVDSSLDWGQGLVQLGEYLRENKINRVFLSYFGSGRPDAYGIDYEPLYSFFPLPPSKLHQPDSIKPTHIVISATNLQGAYFTGDPFARFRNIEPEAVVGGTMYVFRIDENAR